MLERGAEKQPGEFPNTMEHVLQELRLTLPDGSVYGKANGFMEYVLTVWHIIYYVCGTHSPQISLAAGRSSTAHLCGAAMVWAEAR